MGAGRRQADAGRQIPKDSSV